MTTITLDLTAVTLRHADRVTPIHRRAAQLLRALVWCGDGFLSIDLVGLPEDTIRQTYVSPLRNAMRAVGVPYSVELVRVGRVSGYRLLPALRVSVVGNLAASFVSRDADLISRLIELRADGSKLRTIAAHLGITYMAAWRIARRHPQNSSATAPAATQPTATAPATSTTRIAQSSSLSNLSRAPVSSSDARGCAGDVQSIGAVSASTSSVLLLVGDEQSGTKQCGTIRAKTETLGANQ